MSGHMAGASSLVFTEEGADITTTVTFPDPEDTRSITFDVSRRYGDQWRTICINLTEDEAKDLIRSMVNSLNEYQRLTRSIATATPAGTGEAQHSDGYPAT